MKTAFILLLWMSLFQVVQAFWFQQIFDLLATLICFLFGIFCPPEEQGKLQNKNLSKMDLLQYWTYLDEECNPAPPSTHHRLFFHRQSHRQSRRLSRRLVHRQVHHLARPLVHRLVSLVNEVSCKTTT